MKEHGKEYVVKKISGNLTPNGRGQAPLWQEATALSAFRYPWETGAPPRTTFRALHNDRWLYCLFDVEDHHAYVYLNKNDKTEVASSSRVEIFFRVDEKLAPYYCLEIDPAGRVFDYKATHYREFDVNWTWPAGHLIVKTGKTEEGYTVELAVSKASLKELGLLKDNRVETGLYRGDSFPKADGGYDFRWISWVKPDSPSPDFHIASSFGTLLLE